ncbi:uncharacterized protein HD556DRAFT_1501820 [Suillus plorans]|uniref:C2H2-type domain-containing protein n=1 Tax=Suillus plorans TaxID=116603 RepID=A0A9P7DCQ9_9AGAM|nr:uncharacterized protein HD556DRAFT_1501820 [Suillus plorans]KAG1787534.1 hypothetical protein HD556DRAFT_1501820 [Suillus plorans]
MDVDVHVDDEDEDAMRRLIGTKAGATSITEVDAKSIKCSECGKVFKNTALANYHVEKSGHDQFEESTEEVCTPWHVYCISNLRCPSDKTTCGGREEAEVGRPKKIAAKHSVKSQQEAEEGCANEAIRCKSGKNISKLKDELQAEELVKEETLEDARAKTQIEADKKARAEKAAREKALHDGQPVIDTSASASTTPSVTASLSSGTSRKDFKDTRLQIRMASGGTPYKTTLPSDASMSHTYCSHFTLV